MRVCTYIDSQDHPRGCGEHAVAPIIGNIIRGSSPRMRGALSVINPYPPARGIIPADAGSTRP